MAEPVGIFIEIDLDEKSVKKLLNQKFENAKFGNKLGYYFSELLFECNTNPANVFIFNYDKSSNKCFIAWLLNSFDASLMNPYNSILEIISSIKESHTTNYAMVASTYPEVHWAYEITNNNIKKINPGGLPENIKKDLSNKFWSFSSNNDFPEPKKALTKRNYYFKSFKNYYKKYLVFIEEQEKPKKIVLATKESPYNLFDKIYTFNNKVYEFRTYTNQIIEIPSADPFTFRNVSGILADKNHVYLCQLTHNSPPNIHPKYGKSANNPNAIWEYKIIDYIDGESFDYVKEKWDTVYWKDKNNAFIYNRDTKQLKKVNQADSTSFEYLDFCFAKDKNHVFFLDIIIPIDVNNYKLNKNGFIYDDNNIFHYENQITLNAPTFEVIKFESSANPFIGSFILKDKNGTYEYNRSWENKKIKGI